jgi:hypothetical protein
MCFSCDRLLVVRAASREEGGARKEEGLCAAVQQPAVMPRRSSCCAVALLLGCCGPWLQAASERTPLTEIAPEPVELAAFAATVSGALSKLTTVGSRRQPVVHVVGASSVERSVDWGAVCTEHDGARIVLIGPQIGGAIDASEAAAWSGVPNCQVTAVEGMFSESLLLAELGPADPAIHADMIMLHNADIYMPYWRRTLAELLLLESESRAAH